MITSRDNPRVKRWARLQEDARFRREEGKVIVEGTHLVGEALQAGVKPHALLVSESGLARDEIQRLLAGREPVVLADGVFKRVADVDSPQGVAAEIPLPRIQARGHTVFLEGIQDPSNVGAIVRTAAAFGVKELVLDRACADAWGPKALRAGMGGHFKLAIRQVDDLAGELVQFSGTLVAAVPADGEPLADVRLEGRLGWIFGAEGRGLSERAGMLAKLKVAIPMKAGTESLNVAAAAAICLYEGFRRAAEQSRR